MGDLGRDDPRRTLAASTPLIIEITVYGWITRLKEEKQKVLGQDLGVRAVRRPGCLCPCLDGWLVELMRHLSRPSPVV
jgi:hypothetical protein